MTRSELARNALGTRSERATCLLQVLGVRAAARRDALHPAPRVALCASALACLIRRANVLTPTCAADAVPVRLQVRSTSVSFSVSFWWGAKMGLVRQRADGDEADVFKARY